MADEKIHTIPLRKEFSKAPRYKRTAKSIRAVKKYLKRHLKSEFKIGKYLNQELWKHGMKNPPPKIKIKVTKKDNIFYADYINAPEVKEEPKKKKTSLKEKLKAKKEPEKKEIVIKKEEKKTQPKEKTPKIKKETLVKEDKKPVEIKKIEKPKEVKKETKDKKVETKKEVKK